MRAELLVLRKWPAAWGLLLLTPMLVLLSDYVAQFIFYLSLTPADYATDGTPAQTLPALLSGQFNIVAVMQFAFTGTAPFIVLGAAMAGGDWSRGTITTALLQRPGRARTFAGQALALAIAVTASVLATFAVAAAASMVIGAAESSSANPLFAAMPPTMVIAESVGAALFVALTYAILGLFLGTVCRSGVGAIAIGLLWTLIFYGQLYDLGVQFPDSTLRTITDLSPGAAASVVTGLFGDPGPGGAASQNYPTVSLTQAVVTLTVYLTVALGLTIFVLWRRDAVTEPGRRLRLRRRTAVRSPGTGQAPARQRSRTAGGGVVASLTAELLVMSKRPSVWALALVLPGDMLLNGYFSSYVLYATANTGDSLGVSSPLVLSTMLPSQYLTTALDDGFGQQIQVGYIYGAVVLMLLGALVGGSDWDRNTIKTTLLQGPSRLRAFTGQALAVGIVVAASVALTFALAAAASALVALQQSGSPDPAGNQFPSVGHLAAALAAALAMGMAYAAGGLALGVWLRSAAAGIGAVLLLAVVAQPSLEYFSTQLHGVVLHLYDVLPDAATNTLANLEGNPTAAIYGSAVPYSRITPGLAFLTLGLYAAVFLAIPALITRRRDIA
jgi:ABC-2 type transport system permease protein